MEYTHDCMHGRRSEAKRWHCELFTVLDQAYSAMATDASHNAERGGQISTMIMVVSRSSNDLYFSWRVFIYF